MSHIYVPASYPDREIRGKMRAWKADLIRKHQVFERVYDKRSKTLMPVIKAFVYRNSKIGKQRALKTLTRMLGPCVYLEGVRFNPDPIVVYSHLYPQASVTIGAPIDTGLMQDCVTINYILAGVLPANDYRPTMMGIAEGYWTMEIPDHAIGRCIHRTGQLPETLIREAHHNVLRLNPSLVFIGEHGFDNDARFHLRAGPGGFVCTFRVAEEVSRKEMMARIRADTWIGEEDDHQKFLVGHGHPGARLADSWLAPAPLRRIIRDGDKFKCEASKLLPIQELLYQ